jgi:hypothetical protein
MPRGIADNLLQVHISHRGRTLSSISSDLKSRVKKLRPKLMTLARQTGQKMGDYIDKGRHRARGKGPHLADYLRTAEPHVSLRGDNLYIGVGSIKILNALFKYWSVLNYGRVGKGGSGSAFVPPPTYGWFRGGRGPIRGGAGRKEAWFSVRGPDGYYMVPKKAIRPINYIEKAQHWLSARWSRYFTDSFKKQ